MAGITSLGVGSGLDLENLVSNLIEAERTPALNRLNLQEARTQASISAYGSLKSSLSEFQTIIADLKDLTDFQGRTATSSDETLFTATADNTAGIATTNINVLNLAQAHKLKTNGEFSSPESTVGTGTLTIEVAGSAFNVDITSSSLTDIKEAINASNAGEHISAHIITVDDGSGGTFSELVLTAKQTGLTNAIEITVSDDDGLNEDNSGLSQFLFEVGNANNQLTQLDEALDATITVEGFDVTSATNVFVDAIEGITITALAESEDPINDPPATLAVAVNKTAVQGRLASFVTVFNSMKTVLNELTNYNAASEQAGLLNGDSTARSVETAIERIIYSAVNDTEGVFKNIAQLGITTQEGGTLELDQEVLDQAIESNFDDIGKLFANDSGIAGKLDSLLDGFLSTTGIIQVRQDGFDQKLDDIEEDRIDLARRVAGIEERFRQKFSNLDTIVSQLNATGDFLLKQLENTSNIITQSYKK